MALPPDIVAEPMFSDAHQTNTYLPYSLKSDYTTFVKVTFGNIIKSVSLISPDKR
jgi:hypothetical protein